MKKICFLFSMLVFLIPQTVFGLALQSTAQTDVMPEWWGADPTDAVDDTAAIQSAFDFIGTNGGTVKFGAGTYIISSTIDVSGNNRKMIGSGAAMTNHPNRDCASTIQTSSGIVMFEFDHAVGDSVYYGAEVRNLCLEGDIGVGVLGGLLFNENGVDIFIENVTVVEVRYGSGYGIKFDGSHNASIISPTIINYKARNCVYGIYATETTHMNILGGQVSINSSDVGTIQGYGIYIGAGAKSYVRNMALDNLYRGIYITEHAGWVPYDHTFNVYAESVAIANNVGVYIDSGEHVRVVFSLIGGYDTCVHFATNPNIKCPLAFGNRFADDQTHFNTQSYFGNCLAEGYGDLTYF